MAKEGFSILSIDEQDHAAESNDEMYQDLNLEQIIDRLAAKCGSRVRKQFNYMPGSAEEEAYRRAVYNDVKKDAMYEALIRFTDRLALLEELKKKADKVQNTLQQAMWDIRMVDAYCGAYAQLAEDMAQADLESEGLQVFLKILQDILAKDEFKKGIEHTGSILKELRETHFLITYEKDRISIALGEVPGDGAYEEWASSVDGAEVGLLENPTAADIPVNELEVACLHILQEKKPALFKAIRRSEERLETYERPLLKRFEDEILYYLSYCMMQREMEAAGFAFTTPTTNGKKRMEATGLYDLALALLALKDGRKIVANDFYYGEGERFFVLTGPNQGGKTTFARSLGQLVFLTKMGFDVPAQAANVPFLPGLLTHFSVEESVETGRGKLMEELVRLAPMMQDYRKGSYVVINELFTTAANYDAQIMGKRVLEHFVGLGCIGIYVTHLKELTDEQTGVVALQAMLDENGIQTFEIRRGVAPDTACAQNQVNKYHLTYEQLKERL